MKTGNSRTEYVGNAEATDFLRKHHGGFELPGDDIFAFAEQPGTDAAVYVLVCNPNEELETAGQFDEGALGISHAHVLQLQQQARREAVKCSVRAPFSVVIATTDGLRCTPVRRLRKPTAASANA